MAVFGRSDINRKFFPIALALLSTEEAINYSDFFMAIIQVCHDFKINFVVHFIMMDAADEEAKAVIKYLKQLIQTMRGLPWVVCVILCVLVFMIIQLLMLNSLH